MTKQIKGATEVRVYVRMSCFAHLMPSKDRITRQDVINEVRSMLLNPQSCLWDSLFDEMTVSGVTNYDAQEFIEVDLT